MSIRTDKVASVVKRAVTKPVSDIASEVSPGLVTVTAVRMSKDLQLARIYISVLGNKMTPGEFVEILEARKSIIRSYIGQNVRLRFTPNIQFFIDDTLDQMDHIQELIDNVRKDTPETKVDMNDYDERHLPKE